MNKTQQLSIELMKSDLRLLYTVMINRDKLKNNYIISLLPFIGIIIDGIEDWINSYNNSSKETLSAPIFTVEEKEYYEKIRNSIKMWELDYKEIDEKFTHEYEKNKQYFKKKCHPIARKLNLYDIYGVDINDSYFCGNTILFTLYWPNLDLNNIDGEFIARVSEIAGKYIAVFGAIPEYATDKKMIFDNCDYGGLKKMPFGNEYNYKFLLFSMLCQINFVLISVDKWIIEEVPTKLRFLYLIYYYIIKMLPKVYEETGIKIIINDTYVSVGFRNAMAHYKLGVALNEKEIIMNDMMYGLTQKYLELDYYSLKEAIINELESVRKQLNFILNIDSKDY